MKVFISHAWKSKTTGPLIPEILTFLKDDLECEVFKDNEVLVAGNGLKAQLKEAIQNADIFLLLWSEFAMGSKTVAFEIETAVNLGKDFTVCLLDKTPMEKNENLRKVDPLGIDCTAAAGTPKRKGAFTEIGNQYIWQSRLKQKIISIRAGRVEPLLSDKDKATIKKTRALLGSLQDFLYLKNESDSNESDRATMLHALHDTCELMEIANDPNDPDAQFFRAIKYIMDVYKAAGNDKNKLQVVLSEVIKLGAMPHPIAQMSAMDLKKEIEQKIASIQGNADTGAANYNTVIQGFDRQINGPGGDPSGQVRALLKQSVPAVYLEASTALISDYLVSAPRSLGQFVALVEEAGVPALILVANVLHNYLIGPNDLIPDDQGVLGKLDDAWLIHNIISASIGQQYFVPEDFPVNWQHLIQANALVEQMLPPVVLQTLQMIMQQNLMIIQENIRQMYMEDISGNYNSIVGYNPGFSDHHTQDFESLRDQLAPSLGGMFLKYGI